MCKFCEPNKVQKPSNTIPFDMGARLKFVLPNVIEMHIDDYDRLASFNVNFCPMCGRKLDGK